jgi:hypothetical protein
MWSHHGPGGTNRKCRNAPTMSALGGNPDGICWLRAFPLLTRSGRIEMTARMSALRGKRTGLGDGIRSAFDPSATSTGLKFRNVAVACAICFVPESGGLSSETAHGHHAARPSVFAQDDGRAPKQRRRSFAEWLPASALVQTAI